ncbi:hypothetical protein G6O67_008122 [Ophiocordyceps sinensis]|uniref:Uncharacterized protein n=1 Tax=Ophiocordyceps sinensis TaxID=72228 RepID=A0A8H4LT71_9HYPO|nr:hypothetical protein G6O67_008122 [Ophiocordyceps sinensis]
MATATQGFPQATHIPYRGDANGGPAPGAESGVDAGASGTSSGAMSISTGGLVIIVVIVVVVCLIGVTTTTLFFLAKKREWKVKEKSFQTQQRSQETRREGPARESQTNSLHLLDFDHTTWKRGRPQPKLVANNESRQLKPTGYVEAMGRPGHLDMARFPNS